MRYHTVTVREGELLGPVDPSYDYTQHEWSGSRGGVNPTNTQRGWDLIQQVAAGGAWDVRMYEAWLPVLHVGMYDGWPFWRPVPSVCVRTYLGSEWHPFYSIREARHRAQEGGTP